MKRIPPVTEVFMVVWSGGYEAPDYVVTKTEDDAWNLAAQWVLDADDDEGDVVDVLKIDLVNFNVTRLEADE